MRQTATKAALPGFAFALMLVLAASVFGQDRPAWKTANDIENGARGNVVGTVREISESRSEFTVVADDDLTKTPIRVTTDSLVTTYRGFGENVNEQVLEGNSGFARIRVGDRVEIRGQGAESATVSALDVRLLGRSVAATERVTTAPTPPQSITGTVRSISRGNRFVIETSKREIYTILGAAETPVMYRGETYRILNLEVGDRVRVNVAARSEEGITARSIEVVESVSASPGREGRTVTSLTGRVVSIDQRQRSFRVAGDRGSEVRVEAASAVTADEREFSVGDLRVGDVVEITGEYDASDVFRADTIRVGGSGGSIERPPSRNDAFERVYELATFSGRVLTEWTDGIIVVEDSRDKRAYEIHAFDGFAVQTRTSYTTIERVKKGDRMSVTAFVDPDGTLIAQLLRLR